MLNRMVSIVLYNVHVYSMNPSTSEYLELLFIYVFIFETKTEYTGLENHLADLSNKIKKNLDLTRTKFCRLYEL